MRHIGWKAVAGLGVASLLAVAPPARAQAGASGAGGASSASDKSTAAAPQVSGKVQKYDKDAKQITLDNSSTPLKLSANTQVTKNGQPANASDIHEGDDVRASFSRDGSTVDVIDIAPAKHAPGGSGK